MKTATNLTAANHARQEKALNKLYRFNNHGVKSFKQLIDANVFISSKEELEPELKYNRIKFNRMTNWNGEQDEYYRRCTEKTKKAYFLYYDERTSTEVSKLVFDYFNEKQNKEKCIECGKEMNDLESNYGTDEFSVCIHCYNDAKEIQKLLNFN